jgi:hypothetical protein
MRAAFTLSSAPNVLHSAGCRVALACPRKRLARRAGVGKLVPIADMRGRDAEFSVSGPPSPLGIDWDHWRTQGEKGEVPISTSLALPVRCVVCSGPLRVKYIQQGRWYPRAGVFLLIENVPRMALLFRFH